MSERSSKKPAVTPRTAAEKAARSERLAAEMRKNLMKRKHQQRQMSEDLDRSDTNQGETDSHRSD